jgi:hypothetical protein
MPTSLPNRNNEDRRTHRGWAGAFFAAYAIILTCLFGFLADHPNAVKSVSDAAQAEFVDSQQPADAAPVQLAARKATVK